LCDTWQWIWLGLGLICQAWVQKFAWCNSICQVWVQKINLPGMSAKDCMVQQQHSVKAPNLQEAAVAEPHASHLLYAWAAWVYKWLQRGQCPLLLMWACFCAHAGRQLGDQVPPNATLVAWGMEVVLGASVNSDNSMAGAHVVIPGIRCARSSRVCAREHACVWGAHVMPTPHPHLHPHPHPHPYSQSHSHPPIHKARCAGSMHVHACEYVCAHLCVSQDYACSVHTFAKSPVPLALLLYCSNTADVTCKLS